MNLALEPAGPHYVRPAAIPARKTSTLSGTGGRYHNPVRKQMLDTDSCIISRGQGQNGSPGTGNGLSLIDTGTAKGVDILATCC